MKTVDWLVFTLRILVGVLFMVSGFAKLTGPSDAFLGSVLSYEIVRGQTAVFLAGLFPWLEFVVGVFLVLGLWTRQSVWVLWFLNTLFIAAAGSAILRKISVHDCGCFGSSGFSMTLPQTLLLDMALWMGFLLLIRWPERVRRLSLDELFR